MRRLIARFRRLLPRPVPPESVLLWLPDYTHTDPAPLRYDGIDRDGFHHWAALFDERILHCGYALALGNTAPWTRVDLVFLTTGQLARAVAELDESS